MARTNQIIGGLSMHGYMWWIIVGLIAGFITGKLMRGNGFGFFVDILVGIAGACVGGFLMRKLGFIGQGGLVYTICIAVVGALLLTALFRLIAGKRE